MDSQEWSQIMFLNFLTAEPVTAKVLDSNAPSLGPEEQFHYLWVEEFDVSLLSLLIALCGWLLLRYYKFSGKRSAKLKKPALLDEGITDLGDGGTTKTDFSL